LLEDSKSAILAQPYWLCGRGSGCAGTP
jgi:hypothetical protein